MAPKEGGGGSRNCRDSAGMRLVMEACLLPESDGSSAKVRGGER